MRKLFYFFIPLLALTLHSCNPMDDTYAQLDKAQPDPTAKQSITKTLVASDYGLLKGVAGAESAATYNNFNTEADAKAFIPIILGKEYPQLGKGSSALITYDLYKKVKFYSSVIDTVKTAEYSAAGFRYNNFSSDADIVKFVNYKYPTASFGTDLKLTYQYYSGSVSTRTSHVIYWDGTWYAAYQPSSSDYRAMEQKYPDFSSRADAIRYLQIYMNKLFPFNKAGDLRAVVYGLYKSGSGIIDDLLMMQFDGNNWVALGDTQALTLQFGNDGNTWVPDNTIKYTLTSADYTTVGNTVTNADAKASILKYGNFDLKLFSQSDLVTYIGGLLKTLFPNAVVGQKYLVTFKTYNPAGTADIHLVLNSSGSYELVQ